MKKLTKKQQQMVTDYLHSINRYGLRDLNDVYNSYSIYKGQVQACIKNEMQDVNKNEPFYATDFTIVGHNCMLFSCGYSIYYMQPDKNGEINLCAIVYHTAYNRYIIILDETIENELMEAFNK